MNMPRKSKTKTHRPFKNNPRLAAQCKKMVMQCKTPLSLIAKKYGVSYSLIYLISKGKALGDIKVKIGRGRKAKRPRALVA
jgi:LysM repeat protein